MPMPMTGYVPPYMQTYGYQQPMQQAIPQMTPQLMQQGIPQPIQQQMVMPQMAQQPQQPTTLQGIVRVRGEAAAKAWVVAPGNAVPMLDTEAPYLYINEVGLDGVPRPLQRYRIINETEGAQLTPPAAPDAIRREEIDAITARLDKLEAMTNGKPDP